MCTPKVEVDMYTPAPRLTSFPWGLQPAAEQGILSQTLGSEIYAPALHVWLQPHPLLDFSPDLTQVGSDTLSVSPTQPCHL